jgi:hypothetical protein
MFPILTALLLAAYLFHPWSYIDAPGKDEDVRAQAPAASEAFESATDDLERLFEKETKYLADSSLPAPVTPTPPTTPTPAPPAPPSPSPTVAPQVAAAYIPPAGSLEALICSYAWPCQEALHVKWCESRGNWDTIGAGANYGGFQINAVHAGRFPGFWESWMDPAQNTAWAFQLWSEQGWRPWACRPR